MPAFNPSTSTRSDWKVWPGRENVTWRERTAVGTYTNHTLTATGGAVVTSLGHGDSEKLTPGCPTSRVRSSA